MHLSVEELAKNKLLALLTPIARIANLDLVQLLGISTNTRLELVEELALTFTQYLGRQLISLLKVAGIDVLQEGSKLKNLLVPGLEVEVEAPRAEDVKQLTEELISVASSDSSWVRRLHLLYALLEPMWISRGLPIPPSDKFFPVTTIHDYSYALTAAINWLAASDKVEGQFTVVDVAGVQEFISASRKLRDLWASSYIVSALLWYTIIEAVDRLGPDIVVMPSLRLNPFYLYWVKSTLANSSSTQQYIEDAESVAYKPAGQAFEEVLKVYKELSIPPHPLIPGRALLILPPEPVVASALQLSGINIAEYLRKRFSDGWRLLWATARLAAERLSKDSVVWLFIAKAFEYYDKVFRDTGFDEPPLELRIEVEIVRSDKPSNLWHIYDNAYNNLIKRLSARKLTYSTPYSRLRLSSWSTNIFDCGNGVGFPKQSSRGFDYCTVCGKAPALIVLPANEDEYRKLIEEVIGRELGTDELSSLKEVFSPGERLCPWCFLKRVVGLEPRILKPLLLDVDVGNMKRLNKVVNEITSSRTSFSIPSTAHIASTKLYEALPSLRIESEEVRKRIMRLSECVPKFSKAMLGTVRSLWMVSRRVSKTLSEKLSSLSGIDREEREALEILLTSILVADPEDMWFDPERRGKCLEKLRELDIAENLRRYYALIRVDGDSVGRVLAGQIWWYARPEDIEPSHIAQFFIESYYTSSNEVKKLLQQLIEALLNIRIDSVSILRSIKERVEARGEDVKGIINSLSQIMVSIKSSGRIPTTLAYHITISSSLLRLALADAGSITESKGFVVYIGGDDLLALVPVDEALNVSYKLRMNMVRSRPGLDGFTQIGNAYLSLLSSMGRTISVYIAHYHYPLQLVLTRSQTLLKRVKDRFTYVFAGGRSSKDSLIVAYTPRGRESVAVVPLSWSRPVMGDSCRGRDVGLLLDIAIKLLNSIESGEVTASIIHDFLDNKLNVEALTKIMCTILTLDPSQTPNLVNLCKLIVKRNVGRSQGDAGFHNVWMSTLGRILSSDDTQVATDIDLCGAIALGYVTTGRGGCRASAVIDYTSIPAPIILNLIKIVKLVRLGKR